MSVQTLADCPRYTRILERAEAFERRKVRDGFYLENQAGEDASGEWCSRCVRKAAKGLNAEDPDNAPWDRYQLDHSADHDCPARCDTCGADLAGWLTSYGAEEELAAFEEDGFNIRRGYDCYLWTLCENAWLPDDPRYKRLLAVAGITGVPT